MKTTATVTLRTAVMFAITLSSSTALAGNMVSIDTTDANPTYIIEQQGDQNDINLNYKGQGETYNLVQKGQGNKVKTKYVDAKSVYPTTTISLPSNTINSTQIGNDNSFEVNGADNILAHGSNIRSDVQGDANTIKQNIVSNGPYGSVYSKLNTNDNVYGSRNTITNSSGTGATFNTTVSGNDNTITNSGYNLGTTLGNGTVNTTVVGSSNNVTSSAGSATSNVMIVGAGNTFVNNGGNSEIRGNNNNATGSSIKQIGNSNNARGANITQQGDSNQALISVIPGSKPFGITQVGHNNKSNITTEYLNLTYKSQGENGAVHNVTGNDNTVTTKYYEVYGLAPRQSSIYGNTENVLINGNSNTVTATASGNNKSLDTRITGSSNTASHNLGFNSSYSAGAYTSYIGITGGNNIVSSKVNGAPTGNGVQIAQSVNGYNNKVSAESGPNGSQVSSILTEVYGNSNDVNVKAYGNLAMTNVRGDGNILTLNQSSLNTARMTIRGNNNEASVNQTGTYNSLISDVVGDANKLLANQMGSYNTMVLRTNGSGNQMSGVMNGNYNNFTGTQDGNNHVMNATFNGSNNVATFSQSGTPKTLNFTYTGNNLGAGVAGGAKITQQ